MQTMYMYPQFQSKNQNLSQNSAIRGLLILNSYVLLYNSIHLPTYNKNGHRFSHAFLLPDFQMRSNQT